MVPDSDEINLSTVELQVLTELDRLVELFQDCFTGLIKFN